MQQACGWLHWTPAVFWDATLLELHQALVGYVEIERAKAGVKPAGDALTTAEVEEARELGRQAVLEERRLARHERKQ